jgi:hypothetical protein
MQHVYITYKNEDLDFVENVVARLERAGFTTWTDFKIGPVSPARCNNKTYSSAKTKVK